MTDKEETVKPAKASVSAVAETYALIISQRTGKKHVPFVREAPRRIERPGGTV